VGVMRLEAAALVIAALAAGLAPVAGHVRDRTAAAAADFPGWPRQYEGRDLTELPLTQREAAFVQDFPGKVGRFSDGEREIIIRWVRTPTRRLHASADCFRGSGYKVTPTPVRRDAAGAPMGCFRASQRGNDLVVCETIRDGHGGSWPDVSAWYWNALLGVSAGPWWSFVVAERGHADRDH
jgi:hypothetical protein